MPWNLIHLRNMTALAEAGATILPASPAFYHQPKTIDDLVDTVVARILAKSWHRPRPARRMESDFDVE